MHYACDRRTGHYNRAAASDSELNTMNVIRMFAPLARPILNGIDPEQAHALTIKSLSLFNVLTTPERDDPRLHVQALGLEFPNPLGLAAGFDKNAQVTEVLLSLGFGFVEAGTVTPQPQVGNDKPRIFRLKEDRAVINRLGFNNQGLEAARRRLNSLQGRAGIRGINIGANKDARDRPEDYVRGLKELGPLASYVTVNISSPNTPGLRGLQNKSELDNLLARLIAARQTLTRRVPLLVKIAPDLDDNACNDIAELILKHQIEGLIVSNTTIARIPSLKSGHAGETGGLSGQPLFEPSTEVLRTMRGLTKGKVVLVGVGGVSSGAQAYDKIKAGASLVQLYTALAYEGPTLITRIKRELLSLIERDGLKSVTEAVGVEA